MKETKRKLVDKRQRQNAECCVSLKLLYLPTN
jgi:hypothetical protein